MPLPSVDPTWRLCSACRESMYEDLASILDPTYDRNAVNDWERCWQALGKLYCWPPANADGDNRVEYRFQRDRGDVWTLLKRERAGRDWGPWRRMD